MFFVRDDTAFLSPVHSPCNFVQIVDVMVSTRTASYMSIGCMLKLQEREGILRLEY